MAPWLAVLTPWERTCLERLLEGHEWWEWQRLTGVPVDAIKRALAGQPVLVTTAERLRRAIEEVSGE